jgi:hypothetical protein
VTSGKFSGNVRLGVDRSGEVVLNDLCKAVPRTNSGADEPRESERPAQVHSEGAQPNPEAVRVATVPRIGADGAAHHPRFGGTGGGITVPLAEGCQSGLLGSPVKRLGVQAPRGFESRSLRKTKNPPDGSGGFSAFWMCKRNQYARRLAG